MSATHAAVIPTVMDATANEVVGSTPEAFAVKCQADLARFAKVVKDARIPQQD